MRSFTSLVSLCLVAALTVQPVVAFFSQGLCRTIDLRREWRTLSRTQKKAYIDSVLCLQSKPPKTAGTPAKSRYEEFAWTHIELTPAVHVVGHFLPWHRQMVTMYTNVLRDECGYRGPTPYWDYTIDADSGLPMSQWPIFDPVTGFGGDGVPGTYTFPDDPDGVNDVPIFVQPDMYKGCVQDGPFKDLVVNLGPHLLNGPHCLVRGFDFEKFGHFITSAAMNKAMSKNTFVEFIGQLDSFGDGIHLGGHFVVGGEMGDPYSSPGDPLFYLHHANLDRLWWKWQLAKPISRMYQIGGPTTQGGSTPTTLNWTMEFPRLGANVTVKDVMNTFFEPSCFLYAD